MVYDHESTWRYLHYQKTKSKWAHITKWFPILDCTKRQLKHGGFLGYEMTGCSNCLISMKIMVLVNLEIEKM